MAIANILHLQAQTRPSAPAILDVKGRRTVTFAELEQASIRIALQLERAGLQAGDAALIFQPMSAQLYEVLLALFRLGAIAMFVDPSVGFAHLERCCTLYPPKAFIATAKAHLLRLRSGLSASKEAFGLGQIPLHFSTDVWILGAEVIQGAPRKWEQDVLTGNQYSDSLYKRETVDISASAPALLTFTSGSTGQPKAALRTHGFLLAQHRALANSLQLNAGEIDLATLPIFVLANLASGVTSLIPNADLRYPGKINPEKVVRQIQQYQPSSIAASPALLARLADYCDRNALQLPSFRRIFSGGAPVFPSLLERLEAIAPGAEVTAVYGSTEAEPIAHIAHQHIHAEDLTAMGNGAGLLVGAPVPEIQLRILPHSWGTPVDAMSQADFEAYCLPCGEVGEIVVSGGHVLPGYLNGQGDEETKFRVDAIPWHRTGDTGYLDQQGRLWLLGRCSAKIQDIRGPLYPFAVETAASRHPCVRRTALILHNNQRLLLIEPEGDRLNEASLESLKTVLAWAEIDEYKQLRHIPVDKRHNAKIDYPSLYKLLQQP